MGLLHHNVIPHKANKNPRPGNHVSYNASMQILPKRPVILVPAYHENTKYIDVKLQQTLTSSKMGIISYLHAPATLPLGKKFVGSHCIGRPKMFGYLSRNFIMSLCRWSSGYRRFEGSWYFKSHAFHQAFLRGLLDPEYEGTTFLRNVQNRSPNDTAPRHSRPESSPEGSIELE